MNLDRTVAAIFGLALLLGACGGDEEPGTGGATTVAVTLQEYAVIPAPGSAPAGTVTFQAKNNGPARPHEFVVAKTALTPDKLPTKADGSVDEAGAGITLIGEIAEMAVGKTESKAFQLTSGAYVLFCNVVETSAGQPLIHYKQGMRTAFTVT